MLRSSWGAVSSPRLTACRCSARTANRRSDAVVAVGRVRFEIIDTWHTTGLAGSGSNDYGCADLFVPNEHTFSFVDPTRRAGALYAFPGVFFANMQGVGLGLARRAIDEVIGVATTKVMLPAVRADARHPAGPRAVAEAERELRSARAYVYDALSTPSGPDSAWASR